MSKNIVIKITKNVSYNDIIVLYKETGWWSKDDDIQSEKKIKAILNNSFCFAAAFHNNKLIGMGRCLSDGVSDAYIQDVAILKKFQGKGIGKKIINTIVSHLLEKNIKWIGLIAEPDTAAFYRKIGFLDMINYTPMLFNHINTI